MDGDAGRYATIAAALAGHADPRDAAGLLLELPAGRPYRGELAVALIERLLGGDMSRLVGSHRQLDALIAAGDTAPPAAGWTRTRTLARIAAIAMAAAVQDLPDPAAALDEVESLATGIDPGDVQGHALLETARLIPALGGDTFGDHDPVQAGAWDRMRQIVDRGGAATAPFGDVLGVMREIVDDPASDLSGKAARLRAATARLPPGTPARATIDRAVEQMSGIAAGDWTALGEPATADEEALHLAAHGMRMLIGDDGDLDTLDEGVDRLRAALAGCGPAHPRRVFHLIGLAMGLARRAEFTNDISDLPEAEQLLVEAQGLLGGPQDQAWEIVYGLLADVRQRLGVADGSHLDAVHSLRTHMWRVLMQPDAASAAAAAREAAAAAASAARSCLRVNDVAGAVRALDAGRGLALYAATEMRSVPDRLRAAGHPGLAGQWERADVTAGGPPAPLRRRVLDALVAIAPGGALFDPPSTDEIRGALSELDLDALVYLVPADDAWPGLAVTVPAQGPLSFLALNALRPADSSEVAAYLDGARQRDTVVVGRGPDRDLGALDDEFTSRLDVVCDWAWRAAMGPVIENVVPSWRHLPTHRVPRIALVPMGELALIPWQAARRAGGQPAIRSVAFSQAASARMLLHSADLRPAVLSRLGLVVGDPDTGTRARPLPGARAEAGAIHDAFYRGGRYLGRLRDGGAVSASGPGDATAVREWLTSTSRAAGAMLHLACHGVADSRQGSSYLLLAGDQRLAAEDLVKLMAGVPQRVVGLVVLAACSSGLAAGDYDEAYSLGTAFLAAGARSVLSTQWTIPDSSSSLLMFMFHHHLMVDRLPVWQALHEAQLWMLDPGRAVPATMPPWLVAELGHGDPAEVTGWAGFLHGGR